MKPHSSAPTHDAAADREWLSALIDGQSDAVAPACARWTEDDAARRTWHEYLLIGDVLRSDDLASTAGHDEAFIVGLRKRLAQEPAILAPAAVADERARAPARPSRRWAVAAAAAGVMMVGGVVVALQRAGDASGPTLAVAPSPVAGPMPVAASAAIGDPQWRVLDGQMIRDARLDAYLRAHRGVQAARPGAVSGRFETVVLER